MEQWFKLLLEYAVPILNTLISVRNGHPINGIHIDLDRKRRQAQLMLEYLGNRSLNYTENNEPTFQENLAYFGIQQVREIQEFIQNVNGALQADSLDYQQWRFTQEKTLQQQLLNYNRETQLKLAAYQRESTLKLPEAQKIIDRWPLRLFPSQILESHTGDGPLPLRVFVAPPKVQFEGLGDEVPLIADIEPMLAQGLREFLSQNYPLYSKTRPTEFLGGAWESTRFHSEASIKVLFGMLKSEPTLILESEINGEQLNFRMAYWGLGQEQYCYGTIFKLDYRQFVREEAKRRARNWKQTRDKLLALGKNPVDVDKLGGENAINLKILAEEEELEKAGIDVRDLSFPYQVNSKDFDALGQLLINCHCLVAGWMADVHYLLHYDVPPRLPSLLPALILAVSEEELMQKVMQSAVASYKDVLKALGRNRPHWMPEMAVRLARSLSELQDESWAREQVNYSLLVWLQQHQMPPMTGAEAMDAMKSRVRAEDREYLQELKECLQALGDDEAVVRVEEMLGAIAFYPGQSKLENLSLEHTITGVSGRTSAIASLRISPATNSPIVQTLVAGTQDNEIHLWQLHPGVLTQQTPSLMRTLSDPEGQILTLAISLDGEILASSDRTGQRSYIYIWNPHTGELLHTLFGHKKSVYSLALSPDGQFLASGSHKIKIWNLQTGEALNTLFGHKQWVYSLAISPDGKILASGSEDKTIKIWQPLADKLLLTLAGHSGSVYSVAISPDGQTLVSGSADKTIKIWQLANGKLLRTLKGHSDTVYSVAISPDGETIVSGSADKTVKIWQLHSGEEFTTLTGHAASVHSVAISPDGRTLATGSSDNTINIWQVR